MRYSTDLTDRQWGIIREILPEENRGKHLRRHSKSEPINAVLRLNKTGCQRLLLSKDFPNCKTVSSFYRHAVKSGLWGKIMNALVKKNKEKIGAKRIAKLCNC